MIWMQSNTLLSLRLTQLLDCKVQRMLQCKNYFGEEVLKQVLELSNLCPRNQKSNKQTNPEINPNWKSTPVMLTFSSLDLLYKHKNCCTEW